MERTIKARSAAAVAAHFRTGAGAMPDRRAPRGGTRNDARDLLAEYDDARTEADDGDAG